MQTQSRFVTRHFVDIAGRLVHYRRVGEGPSLVLLHPSPLSSKVMMPAAHVLAERHTCIALDTPGYGLSARLSVKARDLQPYVAWLGAIFDALGVQRAPIYGQATGAQIAIAFAKTFPERVSALVLDSAALFSPGEIESWLPRYLPPFVPKADGSHLAWVWTAARDMSVFFPWMDRTPQVRIWKAVPPAAAIHDIVLDYLRAGDGYRTAYAAAFRHEVPGALDGLRVPTYVIAWAQSSIARYTTRLVAAPSSAQIVSVDGDAAAKHCAVAQLLEAHRDGRPAADPPVGGALGRRMLPTRAGFVHASVRGTPGQRTTLALHPLLGSAGDSTCQVRGRSPHDFIVAPDLPGHGESEGTLGTPDDAAAALEDVLDALDLENVTITADWSTGQHARLLADRARSRVVDVQVGSPPAWTRADMDALWEKPIPDLMPRDDGTHLLAAWHYIRDRELFTAWCRRLPPGIRTDGNLTPRSLHAKTVDLLKVRGDREAALRSALCDSALIPGA